VISRVNVVIYRVNVVICRVNVVIYRVDVVIYTLRSIVIDLIMIKESLVLNTKKSEANPLLECKLTKRIFVTVFSCHPGLNIQHYADSNRPVDLLSYTCSLG